MKLLVATVPLAGHVAPMAMVAQVLVARGHELHWSCGPAYRDRIEATGAHFHASAWTEPKPRGWGLGKVQNQVIDMFVAPMRMQLAELEAIGGDAILSDNAHLGAMLYAEKRAARWAQLAISALMLPSVDTAPFGSAQPPRDQRTNKIINWIVYKLLFRRLTKTFRKERVAAGLPAGEGTYFEVCAPLLLQPTIPELEYPRSDLPKAVEFIGPLLPTNTGDLPPLDGRPVVLVTQGTLATDPRQLIAPAKSALADEDVQVITTETFVSFASLLPHVACFVTNGGYGGVQQAIAHGVPLVVAGGSEEKPEIAARVAWSGAGLDLRTGKPSKCKLRKAVRRILDEPAFRARAQALAAIMAKYDAVATAVRRIEDTLGA